MAMRTYREWFVYMRFPGYEHTPKVDGLPQGWQCLAISDMLSSYIEVVGVRKTHLRNFANQRL